MRQAISFLSLSAIVAGTSALDASIFTFSPSSSRENARASVITDHAAQHLLKLRMNMPTASLLGGWDQDTVGLLDRYSGAASPLFGCDINHKDVTRILVIFEGIDAEVGSSIQQDYQSDLVVISSSINFMNNSFFPSPSEGSFESSCMATMKHCKFDGVDKASPDVLQGIKNCIPKGSAFEGLTHLCSKELVSLFKVAETWVDEQRLTAVLKISFQPPSGFMDASFKADLLTSLLQDLRALSSKTKQVTAVLLPESGKGQGPYSRVIPRGALKYEAPFKSPDAASMTSLQKQEFSICFTSNSSCNAATNSCSGHGFCYKSSGPANEAAGDCYTCKCKSTTVTTENGIVRKIRWGGPACQKRDISSPFFLIAGISILVVMAAATAISMLFHIGQDGLPGVISAGVGPAKVQK
ncbi:hypothetical protein BDV28DRAFT_153035 [Aspergillus coremiiformis]|uniref:Vacuolar sorting protein Vps3844 C-terminal domain-containing protein n=1 Tax=Aspergillus coremiiformis TaxID=138285 RepID=A0A5N6YTL7_9EURO|nr:hypothetical protein BDV28DRAFT_153035 [Aspergillus coremiiformis]